MRQRDYLAIETADPRLTRFAVKLVEYERGIICQELTDKKAEELTDLEREQLELFWDTPTASVRNAPPATGRFPLVVYHAGGGSSFEDNAVLCEFLASHGYVVVDSAYCQRRSFGIDGAQTSARDVGFLIDYSSRLPYVDWNHIGLAGHSAGALAILLFRSQPGSPASVVVTLDGSQDYLPILSAPWKAAQKRILQRSRNIRCLRWTPLARPKIDVSSLLSRQAFVAPSPR